MNDRDKPTKSPPPAEGLAHLLAIAAEFNAKCPRILLGQNGTFYLDMEIIGKLELLNKVQPNPNDARQYQLCSNIIEYTDKLKSHLSELGENHPAEFIKLQQETFYAHLDTVKQSMQTHREATYPDLHAAHQLIILLQPLKKLDTKQFGALQRLLSTLEKTFNDDNLKADDKLKIMMQQVNDTYLALKTPRSKSATLFHLKAKPNPLVPALEAFIQKDMTDIAKQRGITLPGLTETQAPTLRNTSTIP